MRRSPSSPAPRSTLLLATAFALGAAACGDDGHMHGDDDPAVDAAADAPDAAPPAVRYEFPSRYDGSRSSVAYAGQVARLTWIYEMSRYIDVIDAAVVGGANRAPGQTITDLDLYYRYEAAFGDTPLLLTTTPALAQTTMGMISTSANLRGKIAGLDSDAATVMHRDWSTGLEGWGEIASPDALVQHLIGRLDAAAASYNPDPPVDPDGNAIAKVFVTPEGVDLRELLQKFLLGAVAFSQGSDDYLDDATPGKGMRSPNTRDGEQLWTVLEHQWDEGFGYFGAARDFGDYSDDELSAAAGRDDYRRGYHDTDGDGMIDLLAEYNTGAAVNAAKRDRGSHASAPTDFTQEAWDNFLAGRSLIASVDGELSEAQLAELAGYRDAAVLAWEQAIAATVVHYINDVLQDMSAQPYSFLTHAKHWSEMKGFALSLQFNPRSPMLVTPQGQAQSRFVRFHALVGDAPVLRNADAGAITAYRAALVEARGIVGQAYGFAAANLGDANGEGGW